MTNGDAGSKLHPLKQKNSDRKGRSSREGGRQGERKGVREADR
jgi:hypothetical protein